MRKRTHTALKEIILWSLGFGLFLGGIILLWATTLEMPSLESLSERRVNESAKIYDRTGQVLLDDLSDATVRTSVPLGNISRHIKNATIAIEDSEFYSHLGIKPTAIVRAVLSNLLIALHLSDGYTQGGSTITQQVVKNSLLTTEKLLSRKLKEWVLSLRLEKVLTKDQILELYLNSAPYGGRIYGSEEATEAFFGKKASQVSLAEAAYLAALPQAPTYYSPYGNHRESLESRKNLVLEKMLENEFITEVEYAEAKSEEVTFREKSLSSIKAPHFVFFVEEYLANKYGEEFLTRGGIKIITSLDAELQAKGEDIVKRYALQNETKFNAKNAALVAIDEKTGGILTMVGSRDYFDEDIQGAFNAALGKRQPGSAFKPFVYATALNRGYTPETVVFDVSTEFSARCTSDSKTINENGDPEKDCYRPVNYDGVFHGPVTFRSALAQSLNVPSVKVLYLAGIPESLETARDMGISTLVDPNLYGLTLVLGGGEVTLLDITSAYGTFGNDGVRVVPNPIIRIENSKGEVLLEGRPETKQTISPQIARTVSDMLSDETARSPSFGERSYLYFPGREVAVKTGTTNDYRDAWIVGYTPSVSIGAWAGNNDNTPMEKKVAGFIVAPLWNAFVQEVLRATPAEAFVRPEAIDGYDNLKPVLRGIWQGNTVFRIDTRTGSPATVGTPKQFTEERVATEVHSILHWVSRTDPRGAIPDNPTEDSQYENWEAGVQKWLSSNAPAQVVIPTLPEETRTEFSPLKLTLSGFDPGILYNQSSSIPISVSGSGPFPLKKVSLFLNGLLVESDETKPFSIIFLPTRFQELKNKNILDIVGEDSDGNTSSISSTLLLNLGN